MKPKHRFDRIFAFITDVRQQKTLHTHDLSSDEKHSVRTSLDETSWGRPSKSKVIAAVLRRMDAAAALEHSEAIIDADVIVEHVLPRNPSTGSMWLSDWSDNERDD
jgi:hypothetical protein